MILQPLASRLTAKCASLFSQLQLIYFDTGGSLGDILIVIYCLYQPNKTILGGIFFLINTSRSSEPEFSRVSDTCSFIPTLMNTPDKIKRSKAPQPPPPNLVPGHFWILVLGPKGRCGRSKVNDFIRQYKDRKMQKKQVGDIKTIYMSDVGRLEVTLRQV